MAPPIPQREQARVPVCAAKIRVGEVHAPIGAADDYPLPGFSCFVWAARGEQLRRRRFFVCAHNLVIRDDETSRFETGDICGGMHLDDLTALHLHGRDVAESGDNAHMLGDSLAIMEANNCADLFIRRALG
jgi:hypothetical protein